MRSPAMVTVMGGGLVLVTLASCGGNGGTGRPPGDANGSGARVGSRIVEQYLHRCVGTTRTLSDAEVVYDPTLRMELEKSATVNAAVTLRRDVPPRKVLPGTGDATSRPVRVACRVEARLRAASGEFELNPRAWADRSVLAGQDARWTWVVKPASYGESVLVLDVRPVVQVSKEGGATVERAPLTTASYESRVVVEAPWDEKVRYWLNRAKDLVLSLKGLVVSVVAVLTAVGLVVGFRRPGSRRPARMMLRWARLPRRPRRGSDGSVSRR